MKPKFAFEIIQGPNQGNVIEFSKKTAIIGRDAACDIVVDDQEMSRKHCQIILDEDKVRVNDLGSINGIWVNGNRVDHAHLKPGDIMAIGKSQFRLIIGTGAEQRESGSAIKRITQQATLYHSIFAVLLVMVIVDCILIVLPQYYAQREIAAKNALKAATNLVLVLAASNQEALKANDEMLVDTSRISRQEGVREVFIYDRNGRIFFPASQLHQMPADPASKKAIAAESTRIVKLQQDMYDVSEPVLQISGKTGQIEKIGTARIIYSTREMRQFLSTAVYGIFGSLVLIAGLTVVFVWLIFRMIGKSIMRIRDDLDMALKNGSNAIEAHQTLHAEEQLVSVINRCLARIEQGQEMKELSMIYSMLEKSAADHAGNGDAMDTIVRMIDEAILIIDANNRVVSTNEVYCSNFRLEANKVKGSHLIDAIVDPALLTSVMDMLKKSVDGSMQEGHATLSDGRQVDIRVGSYFVTGRKDRNTVIVVTGLAP